MESAMEKEWYYRWFKPDVVVGVGFWGDTPNLVMHPQRHGVVSVPSHVTVQSKMFQFEQSR